MTAEVPIVINTVNVPFCKGIFGITRCPGLLQEQSNDISTERLIEDMLTLRIWGATAVVTLMEEDELNSLGVKEIGRAVDTFNMVWLHLPCGSEGIPDDLFSGKWREAGIYLGNLLISGQQFIVHCKNGLSRSGDVAARLLIELGANPEQAFSVVRKAHPECLQHLSAEHYSSAYKYK